MKEGGASERQMADLATLMSHHPDTQRGYYDVREKQKLTAEVSETLMSHYANLKVGKHSSFIHYFIIRRTNFLELPIKQKRVSSIVGIAHHDMNVDHVHFVLQPIEHERIQIFPLLCPQLHNVGDSGLSMSTLPCRSRQFATD